MALSRPTASIPRAGRRRCARGSGRERRRACIAAARRRASIYARTRCTPKIACGSRRTATSTSGSSCVHASGLRAAGDAAVRRGDRLRGRPVDVLQAAARRAARALRRRRAGAQRVAAAAGARARAPRRGQADLRPGRRVLAARHRGTDYRREHTEADAMPRGARHAARRLGYFHNAGYHELGARTSGDLRPDAPGEGAFTLPLLRELVTSIAWCAALTGRGRAVLALLAAIVRGAEEQPVLALRGAAGTGPARDARGGRGPLPPVGVCLGAAGGGGIRTAGGEPALHSGPGPSAARTLPPSPFEAIARANKTLICSQGCARGRHGQPSRATNCCKAAPRSEIGMGDVEAGVDLAAAWRTASIAEGLLRSRWRTDIIAATLPPPSHWHLVHNTAPALLRLTSWSCSACRGIVALAAIASIACPRISE